MKISVGVFSICADTDKEAEESIRKILKWIGEDPSREGLLETPKRVTDVAKSLAEISSIKKVLHAEATYYENYLAENFAPLIVKVSESYSYIVSSANTFGKNLMPRIAAKLDTSQISDIIKVQSPVSHTITQLGSGNNWAQFEVVILDKNKIYHKFNWQVEKYIEDGDLKDCWLTTMVSNPIPLGSSI